MGFKIISDVECHSGELNLQTGPMEFLQGVHAISGSCWFVTTRTIIYTGKTSKNANIHLISIKAIKPFH